MTPRAHPISALFPLMFASELSTLAEDIRANGLRIPITLHEGMVLDGRNRLRACELAGVEPRFEEFAGGNPWGFVWSVNAERRHLSAGAKAVAWSEYQEGSDAWEAKHGVRAQVREEANARRAEAKREIASDQPRDEHGHYRERSTIRPNSAPRPSAPKNDTLARAAATAGVSRATQAQATALRKKAPDLAAKVKAQETTLKQATALVKRREIQERAAADVAASTPGLIRDLAVVAGRYRTIYLDPPWEYGDSGTRGAAAHHYPTLPLSDLEAVPVGALAHVDGAHLWLWTTWPMIRDGAPQRVLKAWGFAWSGEIVWDKEAIGTGHYIRSQTEVLILGTRGKLPLLAADQGGLYREKRGKHSAKPGWFYGAIERLSPGPRIELFARGTHVGWDRWGFDADRGGGVT